MARRNRMRKNIITLLMTAFMMPAMAQNPVIRDQFTADPTARQLEVALLVEPLLSEEPTERYAAAYTSKLRMLTVMRRIDDLKSRLQRTNPVTDQAEHADMFTTLLALEVERKRLAQDSIGFLE